MGARERPAPRSAPTGSLVLAAILAAVACKSADKKPAPAPEPRQDNSEVIGEIEAKRGRDACAAYVERVCACAERGAAGMEEQCQLARARPEALDMNLRVANAEGNLEPQDRAAIAAEARKIAAACIEDDGRLDDAVCPRSASDGSAAADAASGP